MLSSLKETSADHNLENAGILNRVRLIAINAHLLLFIFAVFYLEINFPWRWIVSLLFAEIIFEIYCYRLVAKQSQISSVTLFSHIVFDSLLLAALAYFTGGANNPFIYLLLLSVALGSFMLTARYLLILVAMQLSLYSLLNIYQRPLILADTSPLASFHLHLAGMWVNFIFTVILIAIFGLLTRRTLVKQEKKIQNMREKALQDEQILGLGIMSASAAHELSTPLSTMAIIVDDLLHTDSENKAHEDMNLLATQIENCKTIIGSLNNKSLRAQKSLTQQQDNQQNPPIIEFKSHLQSIIDNWLVYRPKMKVSQQWSEEYLSLKWNISLSLEQAITNLLDNAADASSENSKNIIELHCYPEPDQLVIDIVDFGNGISSETKQSLGTRIQDTQKKDGLGWGVLLSNVAIERVGGSVQLLEHQSGGTLTRIILPQITHNDY